jgi:hypothetical protein
MCKITKTTLRSDRTRSHTFKRNINAGVWANQVTSRNVSQRGATWQPERVLPTPNQAEPPSGTIAPNKTFGRK